MRTPKESRSLLRVLLLGGLCLANVASLVGCSSSGESSTPSATDDSSAKSNFTRPATDAEKANNAPPK